MRRRDFSSVRVFALALLACACTPAFNWREVPLGDDLVALLPCKPDRAQRSLPLGDGTVVELEMAGCEAGGATFAVARLPGGDPAQAATRLAAWRQAVKAPWTGAEFTEAPWRLPRAAAAPAPLALDAARSATAGGQGVGEAHWRWFAQADAHGALTLYQATVLGRPSAADAAATFFEGLRLR